MFKTITSGLLIFFLAFSLLIDRAIVSAFQSTSDGNQYESLFIHTDRDLYIAGEDLFFQLNLIPSNTDSSPSKIAYLALQNSANMLIESVVIRLQNNIAYGSIYLPDTLSTGPYRLVFFTNRMRGYKERSHIFMPLFIVNRFDENLGHVNERITGFSDNADFMDPTDFIKGEVKQQLVVKSDRREYLRRQEVKLNIRTQDISDSLIHLSVAVAHKQSFLYPLSIQYFGDSGYTSSGNDELQANNGFLPETRHLILGGRISGLSLNQGIEDARILLSTPDSMMNLQYARSFADGSFYFRINDFYLGKPLYLTLDSSSLSKPAKIEIFDKFNISIPFEPREEQFLTGHKDYITASQDYVRVKKVYDINRKLVLPENNMYDGFRPKVYTNPNYTVYPSMFIPLEDLPEISRELISQLRLRRHGGELQARLQNKRTAYQFFIEAPAVFLDAIPVRGIDEIAELNSEQIQRIEIHNYKWAFGSMRFSGIVAVFSSNEGFRKVEVPGSTQIMEGLSFLQPSVFCTPTYEETLAQNASIPDLRQLLFWQPALELQAGEELNLNFFTGDIRGEFLVKILGVTSDGKKITAISEIIVN